MTCWGGWETSAGGQGSHRGGGEQSKGGEGVGGEGAEGGAVTPLSLLSLP